MIVRVALVIIHIWANYKFTLEICFCFLIEKKIILYKTLSNELIGN